MNIHVGKRLFVLAASVAAAALFATGFFVALGVRSVVAGPDSAPLASPPNPGHTYDQIELPVGTWTGLDADTLDGLNSDEIDDADDHVSSADHATTADSATTASSASNAGYASSAGTANSANTAGYATSAGNADTVDGKHYNQIQDADDYVSNAGYASSAGTANSANTAGYATSAGTANSANTAGYAASAGNADTVDGYHGAELAGWPAGHYCILRALKQGDASSDSWFCPTGFSETVYISDHAFSGGHGYAGHTIYTGGPPTGEYAVHAIPSGFDFVITFCCK